MCRATTATSSPYVFLYRLGLRIEIFIVSPEGALIKAFYQRKGAGYELPNGDVRRNFKTDIAYWLAILARIRRGLEEERARRR